MALPTVDANRGQMIYNNPHWAVSGGNVVQSDKSSIGEQLRLDIIMKQVMVDLRDQRYFTQMSGVYNLEKHSGKVIKKMHQIPLLDDRNVNTQGIDAAGKVGSAGINKNGNLYGSSLDMNDITRLAPTLTEIGGRVNRVGFTRQTIEGTVHRLGFFYEFTNEALTFDTDAAMLQHMGREAMEAAYLIQEDMIAMELINGAGHKYFTGAATDLATMTGEGSTKSVVTYKDLQRLAMALKEAKAPNRLKASRGSRIIDTNIIGSGYALFIHYDLENMIRDMKDAQNNPVFIPVEKYAQSTNTLNGEIGAIGQFRIISVPRMPHYAGAGAEDVGKDSTYRTTAGRAVADGGYGANTDTAKNYYDVYPMMAVASEAFTCLGFQASNMGGKGNFSMITKMPGAATATASDDPYGESGFTSIKWTHGMLIERPEWIAVINTICEL